MNKRRPSSLLKGRTNHESHGNSTRSFEFEVTEGNPAQVYSRAVPLSGAKDEVYANYRRSKADGRNAVHTRAQDTAATGVAMVADGISADEILAAYADLEREDISEALQYAAEAVRERELPLVGA